MRKARHLSKSAAAREFGLSPSTLTKAIEEGRLKVEVNTKWTEERDYSEPKYRITRGAMRRYMAHRGRPIIEQRHTLLWRRCREYEARIIELVKELRVVREKLAAFEMQEKFEKLHEQINWSDFDMAQAQVTRAERDLFEASPAYHRYQHLRQVREQGGTGGWRLKRGDWRSP